MIDRDVGLEHFAVIIPSRLRRNRSLRSIPPCFQRPRSRRQGPAAQDRRANRARPRSAALDRAHARGALLDGPAAAAAAQNRADDVADLILSLSLTTVSSDQPGFIHELRRKLPRYHWRPLSGIRAGEALADLQRISLRYGIRLPTSFALVAKTLSQADSIARALNPEAGPDQVDAGGRARRPAHGSGARLEPNQLLVWAYAQAEPLARMPRRLGQLVSRLETGTLKVGVAPTDLKGLEAVLRSTANRIGSSIIVAGAADRLGAAGAGRRPALARGRRLRARVRARALHGVEDIRTPGEL